ncbi:MAG: phosphoribosyl pyrophosphate synthase (PRPP synthase) [Caldisphaera sp.]|uniref:ribose-phosphate diphosphokinase n=1 Tax=Caldisphaera sp. TaxID=2060322 RepID=UPI000CB07153|nr:MAG: phosphoribosyl pyrophosphate synthase (PRPP synthase) [Caldisphaera sp.]
MKNVVIAGTNDVSNEIAKSISNSLSADICNPIYKTFPDGESYIRIPCEINGKRAIVVQSLVYPQDKSIIETILLGDAIKELKAEDQILVSPYLAYARQDRVFLEGEPISVRSILNIFKEYYNMLFTIEIHKEESLKYFGKPSINIRPYIYMAEKIGFDKKNIAVLSPDIGAIDRAKSLSSYLNCEYDYFVKSRDRVTGEITMQPKELDVKGKDIIIIDDIISTGGTILKASQILRSQGARKIYVMVSHAILLNNAEEKLISSGIDKIYAANTLPKKDKVHYIDVGPLIASNLTAYLN